MKIRLHFHVRDKTIYNSLLHQPQHESTSWPGCILRPSASTRPKRKTKDNFCLCNFIVWDFFLFVMHENIFIRSFVRLSNTHLAICTICTCELFYILWVALLCCLCAFFLCAQNASFPGHCTWVRFLFYFYQFSSSALGEWE